VTVIFNAFLNKLAKIILITVPVIYFSGYKHLYVNYKWSFKVFNARVKEPTFFRCLEVHSKKIIGKKQMITLFITLAVLQKSDIFLCLIRVRKRGTKATEISSNTTKSLTNARQILLETVQRSAGTLEHLG